MIRKKLSLTSGRLPGPRHRCMSVLHAARLVWPPQLPSVSVSSAVGQPSGSHGKLTIHLVLGVEPIGTRKSIVKPKCHDALTGSMEPKDPTGGWKSAPRQYSANRVPCNMLLWGPRDHDSKLPGFESKPSAAISSNESRGTRMN